MSAAERFLTAEDLADTAAIMYGPNGQPDTPQAGGWLIDAAELLEQPDPGPTPWLVQDLIVDQAIVAAVGRWKTTKSYGLLDLCISIATGEPAFGVHEIPNPGPVVFVNEESGQTALWRRLDALCRGRAINPDRLRGRLLLGANSRIKLDHTDWQEELVRIGEQLEPRLFVFDPLARMKQASREENAQTEMAVVIEYIRRLRDDTGAAVLFVHHTGHQGEQMRGTSDLESFWETRLTWKRDGQSPTVTVTSEHREAESSEPLSYQIRWDDQTRSMRFAAVTNDGKPTLSDRILAILNAHPDQELGTDDIRERADVRRQDVVRTLETMEIAGTVYRTPSQRRDALGRSRTRTVWKPGTKPNQTLDTASQPRDGEHEAVDRPSHRPTTLKWGGTDGEPGRPHNDHHDPLLDTDLAYLEAIAPDQDDNT